MLSLVQLSSSSSSRTLLHYVCVSSLRVYTYLLFVLCPNDSIPFKSSLLGVTPLFGSLSFSVMYLLLLEHLLALSLDVLNRIELFEAWLERRGPSFVGGRSSLRSHWLT